MTTIKIARAGLKNHSHLGLNATGSTIAATQGYTMEFTVEAQLLRVVKGAVVRLIPVGDLYFMEPAVEAPAPAVKK